MAQHPLCMGVELHLRPASPVKIHGAEFAIYTRMVDPPSIRRSPIVGP